MTPSDKSAYETARERVARLADGESPYAVYFLSGHSYIDDLRALLSPEGQGSGEPRVVRIGGGEVVVETGTYFGAPSVFIEPAPVVGAVGEAANLPTDFVLPGAIILQVVGDASVLINALGKVAGRPDQPQPTATHKSDVGEQIGPDTEGRKSMTISVPLSGAASDTLHCLFIHGPTWDGNVPSKSGRDELVNLGLAVRHEGWQTLTRRGLEIGVLNGLDRKKETREREVSAALDIYRKTARMIAETLSDASPTSTP